MGGSMKSMVQKIIILIFMLNSNPLVGNPIGETAKYKIDPSRSRTSAIIKDGHFTISAKEFLNESKHGPIYANQIHYEMYLRFMEPKIGDEKVNIIEKIYSDDFVNEVKKEDIVTTSQFHAKYLGVEDTETIDGHQYPQSDFILLYNIDLDQVNILTQIIRHVFHLTPNDPAAEIEDLKVKLAIHKKVPLIHSPKMDISGLYRGTLLKAGFDVLNTQQTEDQ